MTPPRELSELANGTTTTFTTAPGPSAPQASPSLPNAVFERRDIPLDATVGYRRTSRMVSSLRTLSAASGSSFSHPISLRSASQSKASKPVRSVSSGAILSTSSESEIGVHLPFGQKTGHIDFGRSQPRDSTANPTLHSKSKSSSSIRSHSQVSLSTDILFPSLLGSASSRKKTSKSYQPAHAVLPNNTQSRAYYGKYDKSRLITSTYGGSDSLSMMHPSEFMSSADLSPTSTHPKRPSRWSISSISSTGTTSSSSSSLSSLTRTSSLTNASNLVPPSSESSYFPHPKSSPPDLSPTSNTCQAKLPNTSFQSHPQPYSLSNSRSSSVSSSSFTSNLTSNSNSNLKLKNSNSNSGPNLRFLNSSRSSSLSTDQSRTPLYVPVVLRLTPSTYGLNSIRVGSESTLMNQSEQSHLAKLGSYTKHPLNLPYGEALPLPRNNWVPNHERSECHACAKPFGSLATGRIFPRRHHCRKCGEVFCKNCCQFWLKLDHFLNYVPNQVNVPPQRCCQQCANKICQEAHTEGFEYGSNISTMDKERELLNRSQRAFGGFVEHHRSQGRDDDDEEDDASSEDDSYYNNSRHPNLDTTSNVPRAWRDTNEDRKKPNPSPVPPGIVDREVEMDQPLTGVGSVNPDVVPVNWNWSTF
ncbi:hypothetical protein NADFUDRAFT_53143 [Nadsonia fulvescens var. elongata DSM 6958]|uniref:FYVE-type domain-containing protein n=1 Tax=Nadsonia fulvescens var. elongata DSM 6958 TaxID=857566 RepID=A0A1E3PE27_9ASCO|nr:hypothetical protein NADFUDRAFT_53143 [Nadsonia fulvescens var. elongata DSM 6958]